MKAPSARVLILHPPLPFSLLICAGGNNAQPQDVLSSSLVGGTVVGVDSTTTAPQCGNGVCESGERPDPANGIAGCSQVCRRALRGLGS
jgi:hypothetical protein